MASDEKQPSRTHWGYQCSYTFLLLSTILKLVRISNGLALQTAKLQETKQKYYKWPRVAKWHQSEALVHYKHKNFSTWHRKSFKKHSNNTDLISQLAFLGMLSSVITKNQVKNNQTKTIQLYSSADFFFFPLQKGNSDFCVQQAHSSTSASAARDPPCLHIRV